MLYDLIVPQPSKMLYNLSLILDKADKYAQAKKIDAEVLLNSRLAPDQFNLTRQVQISCDMAKLVAARLAGKEAPVHEDKEKSIGELKARIEQVIDYLKGFTPADFKDALERKITQPRWEGKYLNGMEYLIQHGTPNLYFHITTAYSILRHNGVEIGKKDYLGEIPFKK